MKRDLINEIITIRARSEFNSRLDISSRLRDIEYAYTEHLHYNGELDGELLKYIPIATVACFDAFFRSIIKELIDFGKPYSDNAIKFNQSKNVKFDFDIINAIQTKAVTVGEFVSHILPCNNFEDINSNLSILTGVDFVESIKTFEHKSDFEDGNIESNSKLFIGNYNQIIRDVKRTFELRHIFCHEFATNVKIDKNEIFQCFQNSKIFLNQINDFIWDILYPNAPETQADMNILASDNYEQVDKELTNLIVTIEEAVNKYSQIGLDKSKFNTTIVAWKNYREIKARFDASSFEGGSMYPLMYAGSLESTTKEKIESLKNEYAFDLKKNSNR